MTAALCVVSPFSIPAGPVPISLATFALMLGVYLLGARDALIAAFLYLALGAAGLPVFSNFGAGIPKLIGPTGGYLFGYLLLVGTSGLIMRLGKHRLIFDIVGFALGTVILYAVGTVWLSLLMKIGFYQALMLGVVPFVPGDIIKIAAAVALGPVLERKLEKIRSSAR